MSDYRFGAEDYRLNYRPHEVMDKDGYIDWEKVEAIEIERVGFVRERTCHIEGSYYDELFDETCTNLSCGHAIWQNESPNYCSECGYKVVDK